MSFKKLNSELLEAMVSNGVVKPTVFQKKILSKIKGGANLFCVGEKASGKTTALIISTINKLENRAVGDSPRALILVETKADALSLKEHFERYTRRSGLRVYAAYEEQTLDQQREEIYYGQDILIATPKRLNKLYLMNSLELSQLKLYILEDAEFAEKGVYFAAINRIPESLNKCQYLVFAKSLSPRLKRLKETFMYNAIIEKM